MSEVGFAYELYTLTCQSAIVYLQIFQLSQFKLTDHHRHLFGYNVVSKIQRAKLVETRTVEEYAFIVQILLMAQVQVTVIY
jgi:hypothetical protein